MSTKKESSPKDEETSVSTKTRTDFNDTVRDNTVKFMDEVAKAHPEISQSISDLQLDYIQTAKNVIENVFSAQKEIASGIKFFPIPAPLSEVAIKQAIEITNNVISATAICNQMAMKLLDAARENVKIYNKSINAVADYNANVAKAWNTFWTSQQQQFLRA